MRIRLVIAAVVVSLATAGCTSDPDPVVAPPSPSTSTPETEPPMPESLVLEGPASAGARWQDGLSARLTAVERLPNSWGVDVPKSQAIVRVTVEVSNGTGAVLPFPTAVWSELLYGPTRRESSPVTGFSYPDPAEGKRKALSWEGGTRIPAGGKLTFAESNIVPAAELGDLTVVVKLPAEEGERLPFTLTGADKLLKQVK
jgi:hypothetical protein